MAILSQQSSRVAQRKVFVAIYTVLVAQRKVFVAIYTVLPAIHKVPAVICYTNFKSSCTIP